MLILLISPHTPLAGRDPAFGHTVGTHENFYSHAPRGARRDRPGKEQNVLKFLLTRPSRGATLSCDIGGNTYTISTHTPLAGRDYINGMKWEDIAISTHTPLAGRDKNVVVNILVATEFLLTRPSRGAT